ncbi:hypothetical protein [Pseudomonas serbica]|jgi:hypothetical protein|uniref:hypothetical protein n=1 Tax=Pseudomonas serbica TaxID=2965074 RepID=UPI00237C49F9|nr:hypothetical protein [Pseudomonas serbica]
MGSNYPVYWPFEHLDPKSFDMGLAKHVSKFFEKYDFSLEDYRRINAAPFNKYSKLQQALADFHEKLQPRLGFGLFALALVRSGFDPSAHVHDRHYLEGTVQLLPTILEMDLAHVLMLHPGCKIVSILQPCAIELHRHAVKRLDNLPDSTKFSFEHERHLHVLRSLTYTQGVQDCLGDLLSTTREGLDRECAETFALNGLPSAATLVAGAKTVMTFKALIKSRDRSVSRDFEHDFVMSLVNASYFWTLAGGDVVQTTLELERRLAVILPVLFPNLDAKIHALQIRNFIGHVLVHYPDCWPAFHFEAKELLGPPILEYQAHWNKEESSFAGLFDGYVSRRFGIDVQKAVTKTLIKAFPALLDPLNVQRFGSRTTVWSNNVPDYKAASSVLNELASIDFYHHAMQGTVTIDLMSEDNCYKNVMTFLDDGGNANADRAKAALTQYPTLIDRILPTLINKKPTERLASICSLSPAQIESLPLVLRGVVFSIELGL